MNYLQVNFLMTVLFASLGAAVTADEVDFVRDIAPILEDRCIYCHGEDEQESGLRLDRRVNMLRGGDSGLAAIVPGKPEKSYLIDVINHVDEDMAMPPDDEKLTNEEIDLITRWIRQGANWPGQMESAVAEKSDHWSFQPLKRPAIPVDGSVSDHPVDQFLAKRLTAEGLSFSQPADPRSVIRRLSIVLTGMSPTSQEVNAYLVAQEKDPAAAYEALVNRLLESPHFGERWGQHWLDVIRWAETNGSESNMYRKNAWIYRDYVIRALNEDKPYDEFLFEQIAGDSVGQGDATGYLVAGPHVPAATVGQEPAARRQARADRMDEILQTIGASALGVTIGCARCHNHKFDPISIQDYYALSAVFQDVEFGGRFPELSDNHPRRVRGKELYSKIESLHQRLRPMGPWEEDWIGYKELHFQPTRTQKIRISFNWNGVRLDEIEVFGPQNRLQNLALDDFGTMVESPIEMAVVGTQISNVNDGQYGTQVWGAKSPKESKQKPWIEFTFEEPHEIDRIRLSTNREDYLETDYLKDLNKYTFGGYRVEVQDDRGQWKQIASTMAFKKLNQDHPDRADLLKELQALAKKIDEEGPKPSFVARFVQPVKTYVLGRGSPENPRDEVFPAGLSEIGGDLGIDPYAVGKTRRAAFARWLTSPTHPLTARVAANRIWHHVFGQGIVVSTSDFGAAGAPPTHPELLDWLAAELMNPTVSSKHSGEQETPYPWSLKHLIRVLVTSAAFRQASLPMEKGLQVDASSSLLWRYPPKRVEAEVIRDSILQASGTLDRTVGGRSYRIHNVKKRYAQWEVANNFGPQTWRRMIYQERMRRVDDQMFVAFDFPDCGQVRDKRPVSTTPLQALNLMNSEFVMGQSKLIADRARRQTRSNLEAIHRCFELLLGRQATSMETAACLSLVDNGDLTTVCRAIINSNEFAFIP